MIRYMFSPRAALFSLFALMLPLGALSAPVSAEVPEYVIVIKNHQFEPAELKIPAGTKVKLIVRNEDPTPEEFESYDFNREKIVRGNSQIKVFVGPLKPGTYKFFGEFNPQTAQGRLIVE
ncbi:cupredoxin domain-containing protein [Kordiimonas marina]|uniref:cupredoxin domain-containing protein n=1 Tax=Kordiimonas marina TaxID=2872312 RepID=UPI001FF58FA3|nr:cupredoxin domain-containing protein [Kordiimonas marina]MCJ9428663.1 cupredoxin domain-containing protein [Kordiimonas marina]